MHAAYFVSYNGHRPCNWEPAWEPKGTPASYSLNYRLEMWLRGKFSDSLINPAAEIMWGFWVFGDPGVSNDICARIQKMPEALQMDVKRKASRLHVKVSFGYDQPLNTQGASFFALCVRRTK